jgi:uncharacterized membrane protein (UPF0127 family)
VAVGEPTSWLLKDGVVLASLEIARTRAARRKGLLGRDDFDDAALLLPRCRSIHTIGMRFTIDAAFCDRRGRVLRLATMPPGRVGRPCLSARQVVEADGGAFARWGVKVGDELTFE